MQRPHDQAAPGSPPRAPQTLHYFSDLAARNPSFRANVRAPPDAHSAPGTADDLLVENAPFSRVYHMAIANDSGKPLYDLPALAEPSGAIIVALTRDARLGFVRHFRPLVAHDPAVAAAATAASFATRPDPAARGVSALELARGLPDRRPGAPGCEMETAAEAAAREAREELCVSVRDVRLLGWTNFNTALALNDIAVFAARVDADAADASEDAADPHEAIDAVVWLGVDEVMRRVADGQFRCGLTLSALSYFMCDRERLLAWAADT